VRRILSIDTTTDYGSIALVMDGALVAEVAVRAPDGFGQVIFASIQELLSLHGLRASDVDCFACATGPGTFTGVRIGLAVTKGLAESSGKHVAGVSNLRAMAFYGETHKRGVVLDARRGDIYAAVYDAELRLVSPEVVSSPAHWFVSIDEDVRELIALDEFEPPPGFTVRQAPKALAGAIGIIAARDGISLDPAALDANYVRRSDAELALKESR
jgi:tRNA threonylcarbamoyladenosine biosynthesis protein TsaB